MLKRETPHQPRQNCNHRAPRLSRCVLLSLGGLSLTRRRYPAGYIQAVTSRMIFTYSHIHVYPTTSRAMLTYSLCSYHTTQHHRDLHLKCFPQAEHSCGSGATTPSPLTNKQTKNHPRKPRREGDPGFWGQRLHVVTPDIRGGGWKLDLDITTSIAPHPHWLLAPEALCPSLGIP